jgi:perosamine synthetase
MQIAQEFNLRVIEDAASALGSEFKGKKVGGFGDFGIFSFNGTKVAVSGEGGCIVTNDPQLFKKITSLASMGCNHSKTDFWSEHLGYQYCIGNLSASLALAQVERIEELIRKKRLIFEEYEKQLQDVHEIRLIKETPGRRSNYGYPALILRGEGGVSRNTVIQRLKEDGIYCRAAFPRMSGFPLHQRRFPNPVAEDVERGGLCLPSAAKLTEEDIHFVCRKLIRLLRS